jgi:hypothetical protein
MLDRHHGNSVNSVVFLRSPLGGYCSIRHPATIPRDLA